MARQSVATIHTKQLPCFYCGVLMTVGKNQRKLPRHLECSIRAAVKAQQEMHEKSGPTYDKWRAAMARAIERG